MSSISGISSASSASSYAHVSRGHMREKAFEKVDTDGSASVDSTELQSMLDDISQKTGNSLGSADDLMKSMDTDGSGSLSAEELGQGMKSLMPPPSSTVQFAQQRGGEGGPGACGMPPPPDGGSSGGDDLMQTLMSIGDSNQDGTLSSDEATTLNDKLAAALDSALSSLTSSGSTSSSSASSSTGGDSSGTGSSVSGTSGSGTSSDDALQQAAAQLAERMTAMLMHRYGSAADASANESSLSIAA